jgi:PAS domain S-box-containing protein
MNEEAKTHSELIEEISVLTSRIRELEQSEAEHMQMEEELRESEEKYRSILENIEDCYFEVDRAGDFTFFNPSLCRIIGYTKEEMLGMNYRALMDPENAQKVFQAFTEVYSTGIPTKCFEWEVIRKDGTRLYIEVLISLIVKPGEKPTRFRGIARAIPERTPMKEKR